MVGAWLLATSGATWSMAAAGALASWSVLINASFAPLAIPVAFELVRATRARPGRSLVACRLRTLAVAAAGALAAAVPIVAWMEAAGGLSAMADLALGHRYGALVRPLPAELGRRVAVPDLALLLVGAVGVAVASASRRHRRAATGAGVWLVAMLARAKIFPYDGHVFVHHYFLLMPAVAVGIGAGAAALFAMSRGRALLRALAVAAVASAAIFLAIENVIRPAEVWAHRPEVTTATRVGTWLRLHTAPGARILASGYHPQIYWLADRRAASRLFAVWRFGPGGRFSTGFSYYRALRLKGLLRRPPDAIVTADRRRIDGDTRALLSRLPYRVRYVACGVRHGRRFCLRVRMRAPAARIPHARL
jgi:hypothetical protein